MKAGSLTSITTENKGISKPMATLSPPQGKQGACASMPRRASPPPSTLEALWSPSPAGDNMGGSVPLGPIPFLGSQPPLQALSCLQLVPRARLVLWGQETKAGFAFVLPGTKQKSATGTGSPGRGLREGHPSAPHNPSFVSSTEAPSYGSSPGTTGLRGLRDHARAHLVITQRVRLPL